MALEQHEGGGLSGMGAVDFVAVDEIEKAHREGRSRITTTNDAIVTPLAHDEAMRYGIELQAVESRVTVESLVADANDTRASMASEAGSIAVGSDHGGFDLKQRVVVLLGELGYRVVDIGTDSNNSVDYPVFAERVAQKVAAGECDRGIVIDGAGIGSAIVANKFAGIRAAHCHNLFEVRNSREHNNANVLSLGGRVIGELLALSMVETWLETCFEGGRHQARVDLVDRIDLRERRGS